MSIDSAPADGSPEASPAAPTTAIPAPPSWAWRRGALFLAGAAQLLTGLLDLQECRFEYGVLLGHPPRLEPDGTVLAGRGRWDVETVGLPGEEIELRVFGGGQYHGWLMMGPSRAHGRPCRRAWWRSPWPTRRGARWPLGRLPPAAGEERAEQCLALTG